MPKGLLERLAEGPVLGDGGYLLELEKRGYVQAGPFTPEVSVTHPEALVELQREFLHAGRRCCKRSRSTRARTSLRPSGSAERWTRSTGRRPETFEDEPKSWEGWGPAECARRLEAAGADVVGVNCIRNPEHTLPLVGEMREAVSC